MASVPRSPSSGEPSLTTAASPIYTTQYRTPPAQERYEGLVAAGRRGSRTTPAGSLYAGTIAIARDTPRDASGAPILTAHQQAASESAALYAATQRVDLAGLPAEAIGPTFDYFRETGRFPDFAAPLAEGSETATGGGAAFGLSLPMLAVIGAGLVALILLRGKR